MPDASPSAWDKATKAINDFERQQKRKKWEIEPGEFIQQTQKLLPTAPVKTKAKKFDNGKPDVSLVSPELILGVAEVLTFGAAKYGKKNYMESVGDPDYNDRLYAAMQRHLLAYQSGELLDPESGLPHLYHVCAGLAMLVDLGAHK